MLTEFKLRAQNEMIKKLQENERFTLSMIREQQNLMRRSDPSDISSDRTTENLMQEQQ